MNIYRLSGVDEFMSGVGGHDIDNMPPENELTNDQKDKIRRFTLDTNDASMRLKYFVRYPNYVYLSLWDIQKCLQWNMDERMIKGALDSFLQKAQLKYGIPSDMPDWVYQTIMQKFSRSRFSAETASDILSTPNSYPDDFVQFISQQYPSIASAMQNGSIEQRKQYVKDYLEFPSKETFAILDGSQKMSEMDTSNPDNWKKLSPQERALSFDIYRYLLNSGNFRDKMEKVRSQQHYNGENWMLYGTEMLQELQDVNNAYENNQEFLTEDNPLTVTIDNSAQFGIVKNLMLGPQVIRIEVLHEAGKVINSSIEDYWEINWQQDLDRDLRSRDVENIPESLPPSVYAINEEKGIYQDLAKGGQDRTDPNSVTSSYSDSYIDYLKRATRMTIKEEADLSNEWINQKLSSEDMTDHDYLQIVKSKTIKDLTEAAGTDMFSNLVQGNEILDAGTYRQDSKIHWTQMWPFKMQSAMDFWSKVPMRVRSAVSGDVGSWFFYLSGLFPCSKVLEKAQGSVNDIKKVIDHMQCAGDSEKLREAVRKILESKEKEVHKEVRSKLPSFLESDAVKKNKITDFPEVYQRVVDFVNSNVGTEEAYSPDSEGYIPKTERAMQELKKMNIYFINASKYMSLLGEEGAKYFPATPQDANGFFAGKYSMFGTDATIVVFTDQINGMPTSEQVLNELGIDAIEKDLSFSEENTLWHEIAHSFLDQVVEGRSEEIESESQWVSSPQEIAAITYGNLQHIKQRIHEYFESNYPFPDRITEGFLSQIKSDIIDAFAWEFLGMSKQEALSKMDTAMPEFNDSAIEALNSMSKEEQIDNMTNMFTQFFLRKFMRSKVEDQLQSQLSDVGKKVEDITFDEEIVVPEDTTERNPYSPDKFINELSQREDYKQFLNGCQEILQNAYNFYDADAFVSRFKSYIDRNTPQKLRTLFGIEDLLLLMFGPPSTLYSVDMTTVNSLFEEALPQSLLKDVVEMVEREKQLKSADFQEQKPTPVSPQDAEDGGQFIAEMEQDYGADWMWLAKSVDRKLVRGSNYNWYKTALAIHRSNVV